MTTTRTATAIFEEFDATKKAIRVAFSDRERFSMECRLRELRSEITDLLDNTKEHWIYHRGLVYWLAGGRVCVETATTPEALDARENR